MSQDIYDLVVLGAGPGGYVSAIRGAQNGLKVAIIEEKHLGGVCLNWGCIPTKALLRTSEVFSLLNHADVFGLSAKGLSMDFTKVIERSRSVANQLAGGIRHLLKKNKVTVIEGRGTFSGKKIDKAHALTVQNVSGQETIVHGRSVVIATGARARRLPDMPDDARYIWTAKEAMVPEKKPERLLIIGSGAIGIEFASFYNALGSQVTVVEIQERILPSEDNEISKEAQKLFEKKGIKIFTKARATDFKITNNGVTASIHSQGREDIENFDAIIVAVGVVANTEKLGLENTQVQVEKNAIKINQWCQTHEPGIYAIGDVAGGPWLAHKASHEGVLVADMVSGHKSLHPVDARYIPGCTYSNPQIASIGFTEEQAKSYAKDHKREIKIGRFPFMANGKAIALGEPEGMMKTIFDATSGEILGAHLIGTEVTEMIQGFAIAMTAELTEQDLMRTIFPHPTLSEMMHEATLDADGKALHF